jgi:hypothetical protein
VVVMRILYGSFLAWLYKSNAKKLSTLNIILLERQLSFYLDRGPFLEIFLPVARKQNFWYRGGGVMVE